MKTIVTCHVCHQELQDKGVIPESGQYDASLEESFFAEFGNDFVLKGKCPKGHQYIGSIAKERYDILLESAIYSYLSGFEMEAVLGFAASLERAQELYIWTSIRSQGIELEKIESFWKPISSQSERQLGSFLSQWLAINKSPFPLDQKMTEFRNKVVHKGHIPQKDETKKFAKWITDRLFDIVVSLRSWQETYLREITFYDREKRCAPVTTFQNSLKEGQKVPCGSVHTPYMTNLNHGDAIFERESFEQLCSKAIHTAKFRGLTLNEL